MTIGLTIPIAIIMGVYLRWLRPGRVLEATRHRHRAARRRALRRPLGGGQPDARADVHAQRHAARGRDHDLRLRGVGAPGVAAARAARLPLGVREDRRRGRAGRRHLHLCCRRCRCRRLTRFIDGTGPVFAGKVFPFVFITIACGAISGFHALDLVGHDAEAARERDRRADDRLRRACSANRSSP